MKRETFIAALREAIPQLGLKSADGKPLALDADSNFRKLIEALPPDGYVQSALQAVVGDAKATAEEVEKRVGDWFDGMMERATGAYKRWMSTFSLVFGLVLAVAFNCDTINVVDKLAKSPELHAKVAKVAEKVVEQCSDLGKPTTNAENKGGTATDEGISGDNKTGAKSKNCEDVQKNLDALQALPVGWTKTKDYVPFDSYKDWSHGLASVVVWFNKSWEWSFLSIFGWLITAVAVSLGAPFWFDLLSKFMNVRSSFKKDVQSTIVK